MFRSYPKKTITPFPENIDRNHFASWLSGFTDGEGCFYLGASNKGKRSTRFWPVFTIALRADDLAVLRKIQSFLQCGSIGLMKKEGKNPNCQYAVFTNNDCANIIIPHFETHPLIAKKLRDFETWKKGVAILKSVSDRGSLNLGGTLGNRTFWLPGEKTEYFKLRHQLRTERAFTVNNIPFVETAEEFPLFDELDQ